MVGFRYGSDTSGSYSNPNFCDSRAACNGDFVVDTLLEFPAFVGLVAEPPMAAKPPLVSSSLVRERFTLLWAVADSDMVIDSGC